MMTMKFFSFVVHPFINQQPVSADLGTLEIELPRHPGCEKYARTHERIWVNFPCAGPTPTREIEKN
jgi:hypothetical protein